MRQGSPPIRQDQRNTMEQGLTPIKQKRIDPDAAKVVRRLTRFGFEAYLVGGCVRDLLLSRQPKDFDVATNATPPEIKKIFRNCRIIGRRFRLAHIYFGAKIIETSTFRAKPPEDPDANGQTQIIQRDNIFGSSEEDALRRDLTINGLFLDLRQNHVIDYVGGVEDLRARRVRTIGDPRVRLQEDPVRIIRAIKFAARLGFTIDPATETAMIEFRDLIAQCSVARVLEEVYRLLGSGEAALAFSLMHNTGVLAVLFPEIEALLDPPDNPQARLPVPTIQDRSGTPRLEKGPDHEPPRDAEPEQLARVKEPTPEDHLAQKAQVEQLLTDLIGPAGSEDRQRASTWLWKHLEALDEHVRDDVDSPPSHAMVLAFPIMGLASRLVDEEEPVGRAVSGLERLVKAISSRLRVSRKDRERIKQILVAQRRMVHRGRRTRPSALMRRDYFQEAWKLFELSCQATSTREEALSRWRQLLGTKTRRRRRRPRRRKRQSS